VPFGVRSFLGEGAMSPRLVKFKVAPRKLSFVKSTKRKPILSARVKVSRCGCLQPFCQSNSAITNAALDVDSVSEINLPGSISNAATRSVVAHLRLLSKSGSTCRPGNKPLGKACNDRLVRSFRVCPMANFPRGRLRQCGYGTR